MSLAPDYLHDLVTNFRRWLAENFSKEEIDQQVTDDAGYPGWAKINDYFTVLLTERHLPALPHEAQIDLLYLIARNWDIGTMIAWLSPSPQLSNDGPLVLADFLQLGHTLTTLTHPEFGAAKSQFAAVCKKLPALTPELEHLLLALFATPDEYVKTCALASLGKLRYPDLGRLMAEAWDAVADEHSKIACLEVLECYLPDTELRRHYLSLAAAEPGRYFADYVTHIEQEMGKQQRLSY